MKIMLTKEQRQLISKVTAVEIDARLKGSVDVSVDATVEDGSGVYTMVLKPASMPTKPAKR